VDSEWQASFARMLFVCMTIFAAGASFVGIAFQPLLYVFIGLYGSVYRSARARRSTAVKFSPKTEAFSRPPNEAHA
jgi:hypothetical protein